MGKQKVTVKMVQEFNRRYDAGENLKDIANDYNLNHATVGLYIWKPREKGRPVKEKDKLIQQVKDLRENGHKVKEIIKLTGICQSTIYVYLREGEQYV